MMMVLALRDVEPVFDDGGADTKTSEFTAFMKRVSRTLFQFGVTHLTVADADAHVGHALRGNGARRRRKDARRHGCE